MFRGSGHNHVAPISGNAQSFRPQEPIKAGQMSLANVLAVATAAKNIVLLGDPQQLEQPQQGSHPEGTAVSTLEHILGSHQTMPSHRGLFLDTTWRLHPEICQYTSEVFYESRLESRPNLAKQIIDGPTRFCGAGLWFIPVDHEGNQSRSFEEVDVIKGVLADLLQSGVTWCGEKGNTRELKQNDILIIAPYNAQVSAILHALPDCRAGTVDRFQGQQAPVVIYSMTTSTPEEAPHGMHFLYSRNRLNVATSRAEAVCILVGNPNLFEPNCRTPVQMNLANAFCRYLEVAHVVVGFDPNRRKSALTSQPSHR